MPDQIKLDKTYLKMAKVWSQMSHAVRLKVGALVVKNNQLISDGFNGTPFGWPDNICEYEKDGKLVTHDYVIHAEQNALMKLARYGNSGENSTFYLTHNPCILCAKHMIQVGIIRVVFSDFYKDDKGIKFLEKMNVEVCQYEQL